MKKHARVVVIGGGVMGVGLLYHLVLEGWTDVVLVEKGELTSGSTWHAAAMIPHFTASLTGMKIHKHSVDLYSRLERETGMDPGWRGIGALWLGRNEGEVDRFKRVQGMAQGLGIEMHLVSPKEIRHLNPLLENIDDVVMGAWTPTDGYTDPSGTTQAMAAGARQGGAEIYRFNRCTAINALRNGEWEVVTEKGSITCEHVVNAAGCFSDRVGEMVGLKVPIANVMHHYLVTENIAEIAALGDHKLPVTRDPWTSCYYRREHNGLIIGIYETEGDNVWNTGNVDWSFDQQLLPPELDRLEPRLEKVMERMPAFGRSGIKRVVNGPMSHSPDAGSLIGPAPGLRNFWMNCVSTYGITQSGGAGKYLAQWMVHGDCDLPTAELDPRRFGDWADASYTAAHARDHYHHNYAVHYPGEFRSPGRKVKCSPLYDRLAAKGAVMGVAFGWERAKWFDTKSEGEIYRFRRTNAFETVGAESRAVAERVGVADLTAFAKFEVSGPDAAAWLDRVSANRMPRKIGRVSLAHMLSEQGRIQAEVTIAKLAEDRFYLSSGITRQVHDLDWMRKQLVDAEVTIRDVTDETGMLLVTGPRSRDLLARLTDADLSSAAFPWLSAQEITVAGVACRALRVSYVGELGWELHHPIGQLEALYSAIEGAGEDLGLVDFGIYALNSMRVEKAYAALGHELTNEITPIEAGIDRFVDWSKEFKGKAACEVVRASGPRGKVVYLSVDAGDADCLGNETCFAGDKPIGVTTSGAYGHRVGQSLAFAYVEASHAASGSEFDVLILGERRTARVLNLPAYDPNNERLKA